MNSERDNESDPSHPPISECLVSSGKRSLVAHATTETGAERRKRSRPEASGNLRPLLMWVLSPQDRLET